MNDRFLIRLTIFILALPVVIAAGCQERYRYPCQDPANWEKEMCKKPLCEVHRQCPDLIFKEDSAVVGIKPTEITPITKPTCDKGCNNGR
jgi:hypothetical protein